MSLITLLTDFGTLDEYAGVMKGVILSINPSATIVDISHHIEPQNLVAAAYMLKSAYAYFPPGTVHIVVVDPGVGSDRDIIAASVEGHLFLAPNNGVLSLVADSPHPVRFVRVSNPRFFLSPVSHTFHGRDIFAPVGARLASGLTVDRLGGKMEPEAMVTLDLPHPLIDEKGNLSGSVIHSDRFGNLITNIDAELIQKFCGARRQQDIVLSINGIDIRGLSSSYSSVPPDFPVAVIGSRGYLEIGLNQGHAGRYFDSGPGGKVHLCFL